MTPAAIRDAIVGQLYNNYSRTPVAWPNRKFDPETEAPDGHWIRLNILMGGSVIGELGTEGLGFRYGVVKIQCFGPKGEDGRSVWVTAGTLEAIYRREVLSDCIILDEPSTNEVGTDDKWYQLAVDVPFTILNV